MYYPVRVLHAELSSRCNASCPQCMRNQQGGQVQPWLKQANMRLADFTRWFPPEWISQLDMFYACGNYGEPAMNRECAEIFDYVLDHSGAQVRLHTNGSVRNPAWWSRLGELFANRGEVIFGIDGLPGQHEIHRRGTDWYKIMENAQAFMASGGTASATCLVFKHNQHDLDQLENQLRERGFSRVDFFGTGRFLNDERMSVRNTQGDHEYWLERATLPAFRGAMHRLAPHMAKHPQLTQSYLSQIELAPSCLVNQELYVNVFGALAPCCFMAGLLSEPRDNTGDIASLLKQFSKDQAAERGLTMPLMGKRTVTETLESREWDIMQRLWHDNLPVMTCAWHCGQKRKAPDAAQ